MVPPRGGSLELIVGVRPRSDTRLWSMVFNVAILRHPLRLGLGYLHIFLRGVFVTSYTKESELVLLTWQLDFIGQTL